MTPWAIGDWWRGEASFNQTFQVVDIKGSSAIVCEHPDGRKDEYYVQPGQSLVTDEKAKLVILNPKTVAKALARLMRKHKV